MSESHKCSRCGCELPPDAPGGHCIACLLQLGLASAENAAEPLETSTATLPTGKPGDRIGHYKLLQQIGEGGCGVVYMAEQEEPVRRRVALKIIKLGMDTRQVIARFEAERQALAMMDHPNIAKVLDAGATETGRPYFVMELVRGIKITDFCDQQKLSTHQRLELFIQVCQAVQHAHQKGIIHRDLKPSNILVTEQDGKAVPKIIDFGIAKATTGAPLTDKTLFTAFEQFLGTPAYMSPEQAGLGGLDIDTRSDIYSLGVLLYELLTGKQPFDSAELNRSAIDEILRTIREKEPLRPSARLTMLTEQELTLVGERRQTEPAKVTNLLRGDLDWIVFKALEKDRSRRYETANALAADIQRHLKNEPVVARPPSNLYRFQKWIGRNKLAFAAVSTIAISLLAGLEVSTRMFFKEKKASQRAEAILLRLRLQRADERLLADDPVAGLAFLASVLRDYPSNTVAAARLISALTERSFLLPTVPPLRHNGAVWDAEFSPDSRLVVTASDDKTARVWNAASGAPAGLPMGHQTAVLSAHFSPNSRCVVTVSQDQTALIWDAQTGKIITGPLRTGGVLYAEFSPDGRWVVTACKDRAARVWDAQTGAALLEVRGHSNGVQVAHFSPNGQWLVTASSDHTARVWDSRTGQPVCKPLVHLGAVSFACFSPDGRWIATGSADKTARVWDAATGEPVTEPMPGQWNTSWGCFSPDGKRLFAQALGGRWWDIQTGKPLTQEVSGRNFGLSPDGETMVQSDNDFTFRILESGTLRPICEPGRHEGTIYGAKFSPDGGRIVTVSKDHTARIWEVLPGRALVLSFHHHGVVRTAAFSPNGQLVATGSWDGTARIWDASTGQPLTDPLPHGGEVTEVRFSPDGNRLLTAGMNAKAQLWDVHSGKPVGAPLHHKAWVFEAGFSPDSRRVVTVSKDYTARIWDADTGSAVTGPLAHNWDVTGAQFSPDGKRVVTVSRDGLVRFWDSQTGSLGLTLKHDGEVFRVQLSRDGSKVLTGSDDGTARLWDANTGTLLQRFQHDGMVRCVQFSPDERLIVTASWDKTVRVWDALTGQPLIEPMQHRHWVNWVEFSPDGSRLVSGSVDETARLWDAHTGQPLTEPIRHQGDVLFVKFSSDGRWVLSTGGFQGQLWESMPAPLPVPEWLPDLAEALAGQRVNALGSVVMVPITNVLNIKAQLELKPPSDFYSQWEKWFFANRNTRPISPSSPISIPQYVRRLIVENTVESLREAIHLSPTNATALARLARCSLEGDSQDPPTIDQARFYIRRAAELCPNDPEVLTTMKLLNF